MYDSGYQESSMYSPPTELHLSPNDTILDTSEIRFLIELNWLEVLIVHV